MCYSRQGKSKNGISNRNIITRQKDFPHFYKWRVLILEIGSGHISPASLKPSGRFFTKRAKNLSVNLVRIISGGPYE
jgi:hypothetical protein